MQKGELILVLEESIFPSFTTRIFSQNDLWNWSNHPNSFIVGCDEYLHSSDKDVEKNRLGSFSPESGSGVSS